MKLYTEETIRNLIGRLDPLLRGNDWCELFDSLTPIELPSDEEINNRANEYHFKLNQRFFTEGAKWVIEQIKQQEKDGE